ncbi:MULTISPECIES: flagellar hook-basal body protein [Bacillaceae]|uniref:flagellar hook-basal body protein n=1 Tax=Bacillaceae TaxID=186817 RepID=UPI00047E87C9|nr:MULTISPECIES: flagellar hook-basal body protein [Bacillaceae]UOE93894.1 flagellar hook-basal body protein [Alkalihalobacillus sp. LMS39]
MLRGIYSSAAAMVSQQQRQEMLTNNLANANTPGFKADQASLRAFPNMLIKAMNTSNMLPNSHHVGELSTGVYLQETMPNFRQGDIHETGNTTDLALLQGVMPFNEQGRQGALFFEVQNENGDVRYTRNGSLAVDAGGFLVTTEGHYVRDTAGNRMLVGSEDFTVDRNGQVVTQAGNVVGQIQVTFAEDPMLLVKEGNGLLRFDGEGALPTAIGNGQVTYQLQQGFIERSNVDTAQTMTEMMNTFRTFEANQKVLQAYDRSLEKAVNEIGRIG